MLTRIAPILLVANWVIVHSARLGDQMPMRSPFSRPNAISPRAQRSTSSLQLAIGIAQPLVAHDQGLVIGILRDDLIEHVADGHTQQRGITDAADVAQRTLRVTAHSSRI